MMVREWIGKRRAGSRYAGCTDSQGAGLIFKANSHQGREL